mmetsp:Transcript_93440/g.269084  ORF Transcript_93440/g.269084 Transcript_93440/m.269084 type:complete len:216 (-) Transcript_93440:877-1524(-)
MDHAVAHENLIVVPLLFVERQVHLAEARLVVGSQPALVQMHLVVHEELGHDRSLRHFPQLVNDALPLSNQIEVVGEHLGVLHERVTFVRYWGVDKLLPAVCDLLPCLHSHFHMREQHVAIRQVDLRMLDDEPLATSPSLLLPLEVPAILHANYRLVEERVAHGQLLQVVIRLEEHLPHVGAPEPWRSEGLHLPRFVGVRRVQREIRGHVRTDAHL